MRPTLEQVEHELLFGIVNRHLTPKQGRAIIAELKADVEAWRRIKMENYNVGSRIPFWTVWLPWKEAMLVEARRRIRT